MKVSTTAEGGLARLRRGLTLSEGQFALLLILPSLILILGLLLWPIFDALNLSFHRVMAINLRERPFIGLENYLEAIQSVRFWNAMLVTTYFVVASIVLSLMVGLGMALVLNQEFIGRAFVRSVVLLPWALSGIVNGLMWKWIFNAQYGPLNAILYDLHLIPEYRTWLAEPLTALNLVVVASVWKTMPFTALMLLAGLQTISGDLYDAAKVDGATAWRTFLHITLPLLKQVILVLLILKTMWGFKVFDAIYVLTQGGPQDATQVVMYYVYMESFQFLNFGKGSALAFIVTLVIMLVTLVYIRILYEEDKN